MLRIAAGIVSLLLALTWSAVSVVPESRAETMQWFAIFGFGIAGLGLIGWGTSELRRR